nr:hypothetical protein [Plasmopara viticola lesion associated mononegaambi virus 6]
MESRYLNRFQSIKDKTGDQIKNRDAAGNLTERLTHAKGSIDAQQQNTRDLFSTAQEMIAGINTHQNMMGTEIVKNIPLPTDQIKKSFSSQLGYVQLTMRFLQAGTLHFMEQTYNSQQRILELEATIAKLAEYDGDVDILGRMVTLDIDTLEAQDSGFPPSPPGSVTEEKPRSQTPQTPSALDKKKDQGSRISGLKNKLPQNK